MNYYEMKKLGEKQFSEIVDITDPCYDKGVWCRLSRKIIPGTYELLYNIKDEGDWGERVSEIAIFNSDYDFDDVTETYMNVIGVDAGLAGFFNDKKDYTDDEWYEFCELLKDRKKVWEIENGFFSESGYGDGGYDVFAYETAEGDTVGLCIVFIGDDEDDYEDDDYEDDLDIDEFTDEDLD